MLDKKFWIPILLVLIGVGIGGTFWGKHIASQEPVKTYTPVDWNQPVSTPKPPPPGETYETGHWHGDEWHAEPHEPVIGINASEADFIDPDLAAYEASLSHFTDDERATYDRALRGEIVRHREKYPDCQDHEAVFEDADRFSRWYVGYKKWRQEREKRSAEWKAVMFEKDDFFDNLYLNMSAEERRQYLKNMSDADVAELKDWKKRRDAVHKKILEVRQEEPIEPKRRHTH